MVGANYVAAHNRPHPGEFITEVYLVPNKLSAREQAAKLGVAASTLNRGQAKQHVKLGNVERVKLTAA